MKRYMTTALPMHIAILKGDNACLKILLLTAVHFATGVSPGTDTVRPTDAGCRRR